MAWDTAAKTMAVNVIAKVEGAGAWDAIYYADPITIGLMQWFGTRAAGLLNMIKDGNPTQYANIASSLRADVTAHPASDGWWNGRRLTTAEGSSLKPVLRAVKDIQGDLVESDIADYKAVCDRIGLNADTNTNTAIFFMVMYHQTPVRALNIMSNIGMSSDIDRTYAACINDERFGDFKPRYTQARDLIKSGVPPEIIDLNDDNDEPGDAAPDRGESPGNGGSILDEVRTGIKRIEVTGDQLLIHLADGKTGFAVPTGGNNYMIQATFKGSTASPATPDPEEEDTTPDPDPDPPSGDDDVDTQNRIVKFMTDRIGRYGYSQTDPYRLKPEVHMVTDCSGLTRFAYLSVTGKDIGTYTDAQVTSKETRLILKGGGGNSPNESLMKKGDLVISRRYGTASNRLASHVEIYIGGGQIIGHGGVPYMGPVKKDLHDRTADKQTWWVKRLNSL